MRIALYTVSDIQWVLMTGIRYAGAPMFLVLFAVIYSSIVWDLLTHRKSEEMAMQVSEAGGS